VHEQAVPLPAGWHQTEAGCTAWVQLAPLERAKLHVTLAFAANTLFNSAHPSTPSRKEQTA
jgi:hypothetical protein